MNARQVFSSLLVISAGIAASARAAPPVLVSIGSASGFYEDFATQTAAPLENGVAGNRLGGMGSGLTHVGGDLFLALPDRGPNAVPFNPCMDDTVSYINRFETLHLSLSPTPSDSTSPFPVTLTPMLVATTLLSSQTPLVYGGGCGMVGSGVPHLNAVDHRFYFTVVGSMAGFKRLCLVDLQNAHDVTNVIGAANLKPFTLGKTLFLDIVLALTAAPANLDPTQIPAKLEGITFGQDVTYTDPVTQQTVTKHTLFVGNDNDFLANLVPPVGNMENPNQWFVFAFGEADLASYVPQPFSRDDDGRNDDRDHDHEYRRW